MRRFARPIRAALLAAALIAAVVLLVRHFHIRHFRTVEAGRLYRSGQPEGMDWARLAYKYHIRTVVSLRSVHDRTEGDWAEDERRQTAKYRMTLVDLPMASAVPSRAEAERFLEAASRPDNWPVLVHSSRGMSRVGTLTALYRMHVQGWSSARAQAELRADLGHEPPGDVAEFLARYTPDRSATTSAAVTAGPTASAGPPPRRSWRAKLADMATDPWVIFGLLAQAVFMTRFVVQWLASERAGRSYVPIVFWYLSLVGSTMLAVYAAWRQDPVFILGQSLACFIYFRNLVLIYREKAAKAARAAEGEAA